MILIFLLLFNLLGQIVAISRHPILLIISYDSFRYDYINKDVTPTLDNIRKAGCSADFIENVFITKTFTNHHTIATGLYPENHGVLGNNFFDPIQNKKIEYSYEMFHYSEDATPIWIENERKGDGRHSGVMMWPGNEYSYSGIWPTYSQPFNFNMSWEKRVDTVISWITNPTKPANLVMLYFEEPDLHAHAFGPNSEVGSLEIRKMDDITKEIIDKLKENNLLKYVNIFFLSDHGMTSISKNDIVDLRTYIKEPNFNFYENSPTLHIYPKKGKTQQVYNKLKKAADETKKFQVFKKNNFPGRWHYSNNPRFPPIFVLANPPYVFHDFYEYITSYENKYNFTATNESRFGVHGYDNRIPSMRPYFIAIGPNIQEMKKISPFRTVDYFTIWSTLLNFPEAALKTNGSALPTQEILKRLPLVAASITAAVLGVILVSVAIIIAAWLVHRKLRNKYNIFLLKTDLNQGDEAAQRLLEDEN